MLNLASCVLVYERTGGGAGQLHVCARYCSKLSAQLTQVKRTWGISASLTAVHVSRVALSMHASTRYPTAASCVLRMRRCRQARASLPWRSLFAGPSRGP
jgi:hypothetical protein